MGGIRVNGCGATDHYKKIKSLGFYECSCCKKVTEHFLVDARLKIDIYFIPTLTLKSRYAVKCGKCEGNGEFCSNEWAARLLNEGDQHPVIFESEYLRYIAGQVAYQSAPEPFAEQTHAATDTVTAPTERVCGNCGSPILEDCYFCVHCGKKI